MSFWKTVRPAPTRPFRAALRHESNYYRPFVDAGRILSQRARYIAEGRQPPRIEAKSRPLHISRQDGWRYALASGAIVGFCAYVAINGDPGALMLLPIALVPGMLAWAGLRHSKR